MLTCRNDYDLKLIPPDLAAERDNLEIRLQYRDASGPVKIDFFWDNEKLGSVTGKSHSGWHLETLRLPLAGRRGKHQISAKLCDAETQLSIAKQIKVMAALPAIFQGGFVMLGAPADRQPCDPFRDAVMNLDDEGWKKQVDGWNALGMKTLVLFDTVFPASLREGRFHAYYDSKLLPKAPIRAHDPIAAILDAAVNNQQQVFVGMCAWPGAGETILSELIEELFQRYKHFPSFYGWYASNEFPTAGFCFDSAAEYFTIIRNRICKFGPAMPLLTSPYQPTLSFDINPTLDFNSPALAESMHNGLHPNFARLLRECPARPDILMPQDGAGRRMPLPRHRDLIEFNHRAYAAFHEACDTAGIHLWANVESFDFADDFRLLPRFINGGFDGEKGLVQQLESVYENVEKILTFSLPGFFAAPGTVPAIGGDLALQQAKRYEVYRTTPLRPFLNHALGKPYTLEPAPSRLLPDRQPGKLTDGLISGGYAIDLDSDRMVGYDSRQADVNGNLAATVSIDLGMSESISKVRIAGSVRRIRGRADKLVVTARNSSSETWQEIGSCTTYRLGWLGIEITEPVKARFLQLTLYKHFNSNISSNWADCWLLLDEIQIGEPISANA
ncbi:MAG: DUF4434 domain-containing protein [Lentisphaeria bacterium]